MYGYSFYTARQKPQMVLIDVNVTKESVTLSIPSGKTVVVSLDTVRKNWNVRKTT